MNRAEREAMVERLAADPIFRDAWEAFQAQLANDAILIQEGIEPPDHAIRDAVRALYAAAGLEPDQADAVLDDE